MRIEMYSFSCYKFYILATILFCDLIMVYSFREYSKNNIKKLREEVREMFQHAYNGYLKYANGYDELRPLSCDGINTWGSYSLTLIDALDTLAVMGNYTEFRRVVKLLTEKSNFDADINVSVFETNIRIVGGLLSAHLMSERAGLELENGWPCNGPLLRLAEDVAKRLLPAFDTKTGMPYGTVNLRHGVPSGETSVTCTAGVGTFIVEFGTLSRLTGNPVYEEVALNALFALWNHRSRIGLFGNHIDVQTGRWTAQDSGIGAGVDSFYEYLVKGAILLNRPELLELFNEGRKAIDKYLRKDDWHVWVSMSKGQVTLPVFQSLEAYWPGVLSLVGETSSAMRTLHNYHSVWKQLGFLPEFYNIPNGEASVNRENYPLRPELIESVMYLYRATNDPYLLEVGEDILRSIQYSARTPCGYATIKNVRDHRKEDRMESFFLAETTKYLYLLFDEDNFIHNQGERGTEISTPDGECVIDTGGYIFNTEAHPIDPSALDCCHADKSRYEDLIENFNREEFIGQSIKLNLDNDYVEDDENQTICEEKSYNCAEENLSKSTTEDDDSEKEMKPREIIKQLAKEIVKNFESIEIEFRNDRKVDDDNGDLVKNHLPNFIKENKNEKQKNDNETFKNQTSNETDSIMKELELLGDKKLLETHTKMKILRENQLFELMKLLSDIVLPYNQTSHDNETTISTDDFWDSPDPSMIPSQLFTEDLLRRYKIDGKFKVYKNVIKNLTELQKQYNRNENVTSKILLNKIVEFLDSSSDIKIENLTNEIDKEIFNILLKAQHNYETEIDYKTVDIQLYRFLHSTQNNLSNEIFDKVAKKFKQVRIIKAEIDKKQRSNTLNKLIFKYLKKHVELQMRLQQFMTASNLTSEDLQKLMEKVNESTKKSEVNELITADEQQIIKDTKSSSNGVIENDMTISLDLDTNKNSKRQDNDDIIVVEIAKTKTKPINNVNDDVHIDDNNDDDDYEKETGIGTVEEIILDDNHSLLQDDMTEIDQDKSIKRNDDKELPVSDTNKNSVITEFVKSIIKSTMPSRKIFNADEFLARIRSSGLYLNKTQNYELFYCKAQSFVNRFSLRGQFFDD